MSNNSHLSDPKKLKEFMDKRKSTNGTNSQWVQWISVKDKPAQKDNKFLFSYFYGTGLGEWGNRYKDINNNSEYIGDCYHLVFSPSQTNSNSRYSEVLELDENEMIKLEIFWMPLPNPPKE